MPIPAPNLYPDFNTIRLSHVCLNVADLAASIKFYTEILGLQVTDETDGHIYLRAMEERGHVEGHVAEVQGLRDASVPSRAAYSPSSRATHMATKYSCRVVCKKLNVRPLRLMGALRNSKA